MKKLLLLIFSLLSFYNVLRCQNEFDIQFDNKKYVEGIESVTLRNSDEKFSVPIGILGQSVFVLDFDDLELEPRHLKYTFIHCTYDWKPSDLNQIEYIDGFTEEDITEYEHSFNTIEPYIHYHAEFPNNNISFSKSGNYLLFVYDDSPENPILTQRFMVLEPITAKIVPNVHPATDITERFKRQEVDFVLYPGSYQIRNPQLSIRATIQQNGRWDNAKIGLTYHSGNPTELFFDHRDGKNVFDGSAEFRTFDISTLRSNSDRIVGISFVNRHSHAYVLQDDARPYSAYESRGTMNGYRYFYNRDLNNRYSEDYVFTHFTLKSDFPFEGGEVYVFGELTDWQIKEEAKLKYNSGFQFWETDILLKQGVYNYQYVYVPHDTKTIDATYIEGSHFQTDNLYTIYVYFREDGSSYDKLIGCQTTSLSNSGY